MFSLRLLLLFLVVSLGCASQVMNVRKWRQSERDTLENALALVDEYYYAKAFVFFEHLLNNHPSELFLKYSYARCALYRGDKLHEAYDLLLEAQSKNRKIPDIQYDLALAAYHRLKFDLAADHLQQYTSSKKTPPDGLQKAVQLQRYIDNARWHLANPGPSRISVLGDAVNSEFDEYSPAIDANAGQLVFAMAGPACTGGLQLEDLGEDIRNHTYLEDVFVSDKHDRLFSVAVPLDSLNTMVADRVVAMSPDGRKVLMFVDQADGHGDIYESRFNGKYFERPYRLQGQVNGFSKESHAAYSPDGQTLYFSSDRAGGFGGLDIYRVSLVDDTLWTNLQNLGDSVNTSGEEDTPFMWGDGRTLFFSSTGRNSMGGFDVFMTTMADDSTFSGTRNLGYPVNGTWDDLHFVLAADGRGGYMSSERKEGMGMRDVFYVETNFATKAEPVYLAKGAVRGPSGPVTATVVSTIVEPVERFYTRTSGDSAGEYLLELSPGFLYSVQVTYPGLVASSFTIDTRGLAEFREATHDVRLVSFASSSPTAVVAAGTRTAAVSGTVAAGSSGKGAVSSTSTPWPDKTGFMPITLLQKKTMRYMERYGNVSDPDLVFLVQFAAVKGRANMYFPKLSKYGRVERLRLGDGYTRLTVGGKYATLNKAFSMNKKAIRAGQEESFVIALYKGKRIQFEELESLGVFK